MNEKQINTKVDEMAEAMAKEIFMEVFNMNAPEGMEAEVAPEDEVKDEPNVEIEMFGVLFRVDLKDLKQFFGILQELSDTLVKVQGGQA